MLFNLKKQAQEFIFSRKRVRDPHRSVFFSNAVVGQSASQNHLDIYLDKQFFISKRFKWFYQRED